MESIRVGNRVKTTEGIGIIVCAPIDFTGRWQVEFGNHRTWYHSDEMQSVGMDADEVRWLAQKVVAKAFHGVSDASVEALARRVLELEADAEEHTANVRRVEREACAIAGAAAVRHSQQTTDQCRADVAAAIRARGEWRPEPHEDSPTVVESSHTPERD